MQDIFKTIREERQDFLNNEIEVVPGYNHSQYDTVKKIHLYYNSHYVDGDYEEVNGVTRKRIFDNMNSWRCEVATKMLDIDVKDFPLVGTDPDKDWNVFLLEKELKVWLKKHELGQKLNQIVEYLPVYGSVVLEKVKDGVQLVDLRYLYNDQAAESLEKARYINIKHYMSVGELRKMKGKWDNVDEAIDAFAAKRAPGYDLNDGTTKTQTQPEGVPQVEIYKRYGEVPLSWFTDKAKDDNEYVLAKFIVAGIDNYTKNDEGVIIEEEGLILYKEQLKELPLKEVHYTKTIGRWLGIGIVEKLFEPQRRRNEIKNQEAKAMELAAITLLQTSDQTVVNNILTDVENGQILTPKSPITAVPTEARDLVAFTNAATATDTSADRLTFSYDVVRGDAAPASATLGSIQIQEQQAASAFDYKRENIKLFIAEYIKDIVFPQIEKELNAEHTLRFVGSLGDVQKIKEGYARCKARKMQWELFFAGKPIPEEDVLVQEILQSFESGNNLWVKIQKDFYKGLDWEVDIVTGENKNIFADLQNAQGVLNLLSADPTALQDPVKRKILFKVLSNIGMHTAELEEMESEAQMMPQPLPEAPQLATANEQRY